MLGSRVSAGFETGLCRRNPGVLEIHLEQIRINEALRRLVQPEWNSVSIGGQAKSQLGLLRELAPTGLHVALGLGKQKTAKFEQGSATLCSGWVELEGLVGDRGYSLIRIEAEGAEELVLREARETIARCRPMIVFESTLDGARRLGLRREDVFSLLYDEMGYEIFLPREVLRDGRGLELAGFEKAALFPYLAFHFIAIPREQCSQGRWAARVEYRLSA